MYVGEKEGQPHVEFSLPAIGVMHTSAKTACFLPNELTFVMEVNSLDGVVTLKVGNGGLVGEMYVKEVDMRFPVELQKCSDEYMFCDEYYRISEENRAILRENNTYSSAASTVHSTYVLNDANVLSAAQDMGIAVENRHDFATICELMRKTEHVIHHDGVNYHHADQPGTLAQLRQAAAQHNMTNCRGLAIIYSGILRAYGFCSSYVECWPADPDSTEIHVVCEVYAPDLRKQVAVDISQRMIFFRKGVPLSLPELRDAIIAGEESTITCNEDARNSLDEALAYLSKNLVVFCKQRDNNETDEIVKANAIYLAPQELTDVFAKRWNAGYITSSRKAFYA